MFMNKTDEDVAESAYHVMMSRIPDSGGAPTMNDIASLGLALWGHTYKHHPDDDYGAYTALLRWAQTKSTALQAACLVPSEQISMLGSARWADQAFPRFIMSHSYAAGLMATALSEEALEFVRAPYRAFMIDVPDGLLTLMNDQTGREAKIRWILVHEVQSENRRPWQYIAHTDESICTWRHGVDAKMLCEPELPENRWEGYAFMAPKDDRDDRVAALIGRLIVGVCLAVQDPSNVKATSRHVRTDPARMKADDVRTFRLGKPLKIDCRKTLQDYVSGVTNRVQNVRTLVRGHWRMQRHGPKLSLKKPLWLKPFWRGPEDGPVLVRPTMMGDVK